MDLINLSFVTSDNFSLNALNLEYNYWLVFCSFLVAWMGAYAGLTIVISIQSSVSHFAKAVWLLAGSLTLGCAVWSMHYIGMLAFTLPVPAHHHIGLTLISVLPAILASFVALLQLSKKQQSRKSTLISGLFLGVGIGTMHYVGMAAMTGAFTLVYDPWIFALSIITAVGLAIISLYSRNTSLLIGNSKTLNRLFISAPIMGLAITGMHYIGMQAAIFFSNPDAQPMLHGLDHDTLSIIVTALTVGLSLTAMISTNINGMFVRLYAAVQDAEAASQAKANFLAHMSHEIRTPVNAVIGMARLALRTDVTPKQADYLNKINTASQNLLAIINDILDFSKIEAGKLQLDQSDFSIEEVSQNIHNLFEDKANEKNLQLSVHIEKNVPARLYGDSLRLNQVFINLVANAIKFTERGVVTVTIDVREYGGNAVILECSVRDSGIGISSDQLDHIFDLFNQADNTITRQFGGTGLGLAICKQLCELMHGRIWVESSPNLGTAFHFNLQMEKAQHRENVKTLPHDMPLPNVLVVDDDPVALEVLSGMLVSFGLKPKTALSAKRALELLEQACLEQTPFQLALIDWRMPEMDGVELVRAMQESQSIGVCPEVLIVSAHAREELWPAIKELGVLNYLIKPIHPSTLFDTIYSIFSTEHMQTFEPMAAKVPALSLEVLKSITGTSVLLVEDNAFNQQVAIETLESMGIVVDLANDGRECLSKLEQGEYDLVLMDIQMPNMDGLTAAREIRKRWPDLNLPIIAMTAHALPADKTKSLQAGMNQHITKPFDPDELAMSIHHWLPYKNVVLNDVNASTINAHQGPTGKESSQSERKQSAFIFGDNEAAQKILTSFCDVYHPDKNSLQRLFDNSDLERATFLVHGMKSAAAYLGNVQLSQHAAQIEACLKSSRAPGRELINAFDTELLLAWQAAKRDLDQLVSFQSASQSNNVEEAEKSSVSTDRNKILVVDDDRLNRQLITEILKLDYQIILANDAAEAMECALLHLPDLILLDIMMPSVNGFELFTKIKKHPLIMHIPIIFLTALTLDSEEEAGLAMGAVDYITKPLRVPIVQARIKNHIQLINQRKQLELMSAEDPLTGIPNRRRFDDAITNEWSRGKRNQSPLSVAMIDVDNFKAYNDNYGHAAGDAALRAIARALMHCVSRAADVCARVGGEEFALILPDTSAEDLATITERCRHAVEALKIHHANNPPSNRVTVSIGGATTIPSDEMEPADLLKTSDERLYIAKQQGRNQVVLHE